jgi:predicted Zn-dependent protease
LLTLVLAAGLLPVGGCSSNPATGQAQLNMISEAEEVKLGSESAPRFIKQMGGEVPDAEIRRYVSRIGRNLAGACERPHLPWEFFVVDSAMLNAFALPGGKVFVSRRLMIKLNNEAELAGVLGHEIGHVTAEHIGQQMTQASLLNIGLQVATRV